jgi:rhodanese-related sulfurtransferase
LVQVGVDRPAAAAIGSPGDWLREGERARTFRRAGFAELAEAYAVPGRAVILDVRRDSERAGGHISGSVHIPVHQVRDRLTEIPDGTVWVHCAGGMRAAIAASLLDAAGREVVAVDDSFAAAGTSGLPMARTAPAGAREPRGRGAGAGTPDVPGPGGRAEPPTDESSPARASALTPATATASAPAPASRHAHGNQAYGDGAQARPAAAALELDGPEA